MSFNPYVAVVVAATIWGSAGVFIKYLALSAATITFFRFAVPSAVMLAYFIFRRSTLPRGDRLIFLGSLANVLKTFFYFLGFTLASIGNAVVVYFIWPILTAALGSALLKERVSGRNTLLFAVAAAGIVLVYLDKEFSFSNRDFAGMAAMLVSALATAVFMVVFKKSTERYSNPELIFHQNIVGAAIFLPFLFIDMPALNIVRLGTVTFYSLLVGVIGFALYFPALKKAKVSTVSFLAYFEPVSAILFAAILLGEGITWNMAAGGLLIIGSAILLKKD